MAETVRGVSALQNELEKAKESLKDVDENIKKLTGRDPTMQRTPQRRVSLGSADRGGRTVGAESRLFNLARRGIIQEDSSPAKRRSQQGGAFARLGPPPSRDRRAGRGRGRESGEEDDLPHKPALQSSVIATSREERSRQNSIEEQSRDRKGQARNRRMFGLLLGTLQKFKDDAAVSKDKEEQRQKIEKKLDEKFKQEKEEIVKERRQLFLERRQKQFRIRLLEQKMEMAQNHEEWERETRKLENFIITKSKPCLFYLPKIVTKDTEAKLAETREAITGMIEMRRKKLEEEIAEMMNQVQDDHEGMEEGDEHGESGEEMEGESDNERIRKHHENKENNERERLLRVKKEMDDQEEDGSDKNELDEERERRDRERIQRDRDRQIRDRSGESKKYRGRSRDQSKEGRDKERERGTSDGRHDRERDRHRDKAHRRGHSKSRSRERERHRSGKSRSDRKREHSDDEKSRGHVSKSKRRSRGEGKAEKREKVWEPMEDEVEEEFIGSRESEKASIASKMLEMAGMTEAMKEAKAAEEARFESSPVDRTTAEEFRLEDIPRPPEVGLMQDKGPDNGEEMAGETEENGSQLEPDQP